MPHKLPASLIALLIFNFGIAQEKPDQNFPWPGKPTYEIIPDTFKNQRAVILSETRDIIIRPDQNSPDLVKEFIYYCKVKSLSPGSLFFRFPYETSGKIVLLRARKISKNGNVIPVAPHEIKSHANRETDYYSGTGLYTYEIMSPAPGDQIEFICKTVKEDQRFRGEFFFHSYYPVLSSVLVLESEKDLLTEIAAYNPPVNSVKGLNGNRVTHTFSSGKHMPLTHENHAVPTVSLPYVRYSVSRQETGEDDRGTNGKHTASLLAQARLLLRMKDLVIEADKEGIIKKFMNERLVNRTVINFHESLEEIHEYINNTIGIREIGSSDPEKVFQILTEEGMTDRKNLLLMYAVIFSELQSDFLIGFGKNVYQGGFDTAFNLYAQASHVFFAYEREGKLHYLFPKTEVSAYHVGEVPPELSGTEAYIIQSKTTPGRILKIKFDPTNPRTTFYKNRVTGIPNLQTGSLQLQSEETWSGALSTQRRQKILIAHKQNMLFQECSKVMQYENPSLVLDSVEIKENSGSYPYPFRVNKKYRMEPGIKKENDTTWSLSISGLLNQHVLVPQTRSRIQNMFAPAACSDQVTIHLRFGEGVRIQGLDKYSVEIRNEFGSYSFRIRQTGPGNYAIESIYEITRQALPAHSYTALHDLHTAFKQATGKKLVIFSKNRK